VGHYKRKKNLEKRSTKERVWHEIDGERSKRKKIIIREDVKEATQ